MQKETKFYEPVGIVYPTEDLCMYCGRNEDKQAHPEEMYFFCVPCVNCLEKYSEGCLIVETKKFGVKHAINMDFHRKVRVNNTYPTFNWFFLPKHLFGSITDAVIQQKAQTKVYLKVDTELFKVIRKTAINAEKAG